MPTECSVEGCERPSKTRGWCPTHYMRVLRHGDPNYQRPKLERPCEIDGCDRPHYGRGLCHAHYQRWRLYGDIREGDAIRLPQEMEQRFWSHVDKGGDNECWLWKGSLPTGYGYFRINGIKRGVHRISYEWLIGPVPPGLHLDHLCRVRNCVNPAHLEPVTPAENILRGVGACAVHARKTRCPRCGSEYAIRPDGYRRCRPCTRAYGREYHAAKHEALNDRKR